MTDLRDFSFVQPSLAESRMKWAAAAAARGAMFILVMGAIFIGFGTVRKFNEVIWLGGLFVAYGLYGLVRGKLRSEPKQFRLCPHCGYNITGNTTGKCPECGKFV